MLIRLVAEPGKLFYESKESTWRLVISCAFAEMAKRKHRIISLHFRIVAARFIFGWEPVCINLFLNLGIFKYIC